MAAAQAVSVQEGASIAEQSLAAQAALLPQALGVFAVCLPIYVWAGSFAQDAAWMSASFAIFAINWGAFYFALQHLRRPEMQTVGRRARVHILGGLLWSAAVWQMAAFADRAGPARDTLLLLTVGAAVISLFFTTPFLPFLDGGRTCRDGRAADLPPGATGELGPRPDRLGGFRAGFDAVADPESEPAPPVQPRRRA